MKKIIRLFKKKTNEDVNIFKKTTNEDVNILKKTTNKDFVDIINYGLNDENIIKKIQFSFSKHTNIPTKIPIMVYIKTISELVDFLGFNYLSVGDVSVGDVITNKKSVSINGKIYVNNLLGLSSYLETANNFRDIILKKAIEKATDRNQLNLLKKRYVTYDCYNSSAVEMIKTSGFVSKYEAESMKRLSESMDNGVLTQFIEELSLDRFYDSSILNFKEIYTDDFQLELNKIINHIVNIHNNSNINGVNTTYHFDDDCIELFDQHFRRNLTPEFIDAFKGNYNRYREQMNESWKYAIINHITMKKDGFKISSSDLEFGLDIVGEIIDSTINAKNTIDQELKKWQVQKSTFLIGWQKTNFVE